MQTQIDLQAVLDTLETNSIESFLDLAKYKPEIFAKNKNLNDPIINSILTSENPKVSVDCIKVDNKESEFGQWNEYYVLYRIYKSNIESLISIRGALDSLSQALGYLEDSGYNSVGLQEFRSDLAGYYYALVYVIKDKGQILLNDEEINFTDNEIISY